MNPKNKKIWGTFIVSVLSALAVAISALCGLTSCNVTRVITNESQYLQRGDTSVLIQTKTIETYDATKKANKF